MSKAVKVALHDDMAISLASIEFEEEARPDGEHHHRTIFHFRLYVSVDEDIYHDFPVVMTEPYENLEDLRMNAWREAYILLRQLAELARRETNAPEAVSFESPA